MQQIKRVIFFAANWPGNILEEWASANATSLAKLGFFYPQGFDSKLTLPNLWLQGDFFRAANGILGTNSLSQLMNLLKEQLGKCTNNTHTILLGLGGIATRHDDINKIRIAITRNFRNAKCSVVLLFSRQDIALESLFAWQSLSACPNFEQWKKRAIPDLSTIVRVYFKQWGRENVKCIFFDNTPEGSINAQNIFFEHLEIRKKLDVEKQLKFFKPSLNLQMPPPFWRIAALCNISNDSNFTAWFNQAMLFSKRFSPDPAHPVLLDYADRCKIMEYANNSNKNLADLLKKPFLFSQPIYDERPIFTGLTQEQVYDVVQYLDKEFIIARKKEMDAIPVQYRNLEQHFIVRGFHEACGNILTKSQQPRLSVLTLTYNHAPFIAQNIESVLSQQTSFPIQHIIADDASEDGTQEIISQYAAQYANIIPIFQKKRTYGPGNVRTLFDFARTEYVAICDGDDYFTDPTKLQTQVDFLEQNNDCALCFHVVRVIYEDNPDRERFYPPEELLPRGIRKFYYLSDLLKCNLIQTNSVVYRWRFSSGLPKWFRADCCPGDWYWHLLHAELGKIGFINKTMSVYRRHKQGIYYLSEVDRLKHRATMGLREIEFYNEVNIHFSRKYESILLDLINGVLADCLLYDIRNSADVSIAPVFPQLIEQFPQLVRHFLSSIETASRKNCKYERFER